MCIKKNEKNKKDSSSSYFQIHFESKENNRKEN